MSKKVTPLFGRAPKATATPTPASSPEEVQVEMTERAANALERLHGKLGVREEGVTEHNVRERIKHIQQDGLDLDACITKGGSWAEAARRIRGDKTGTIVSRPPESVTNILDRLRGKKKE